MELNNLKRSDLVKLYSNLVGKLNQEKMKWSKEQFVENLQGISEDDINRVLGNTEAKKEVVKSESIDKQINELLGDSEQDAKFIMTERVKAVKEIKDDKEREESKKVLKDELELYLKSGGKELPSSWTDQIKKVNEIAAEMKKQAMRPIIIEYHSNDEADKSMQGKNAETFFIENQYFSVNKVVPYGVPVEVQYCIYENIKEAKMLVIDEIKDVVTKYRAKRESFVKMMPKYSVRVVNDNVDEIRKLGATL